MARVKHFAIKDSFFSSGNGGGYFPFVPKDGEAIDGLDFPVAVPLDTVMKWWWRVRIWSCTISIQPGGYSSTLALYYQDPATTERSLVGYESGHGYSEEDRSVIEPGQPYPDVCNLRLCLDTPPATTEQIRINGAGLYVPKIVLMWHLPTNEFFFDLTANERPISWSDGSLMNTHYGSLIHPFSNCVNFDGYTLSGRTNNSAITSISASVTPIAYWPYAKDDNTEPIWDSVTGAQLISPYTNE